MICSICMVNPVRPPVTCDKCGALACKKCLERIPLPPGEHVLNLGDYTMKDGEFVLKDEYKRPELCKVCRAEIVLSED
jgi:hypothetical protein